MSSGSIGDALEFGELGNIPTVVIVAIALGLSGVIQLLLALLWLSVTSRAFPLVVKPLALPFAIMMSIVSAGLASGAWLKVMSGDDVKALLDQRAFGEVSEPLAGFSDRFIEIDGAMQGIAVFSSEQAEVERLTGLSCDGAPAKLGCGRVCKMRRAVEGEANRHSATASSIADEAYDIATLPDGVDQSAMSGAHAAARRLISDRRVRELSGWAETLLDRHQIGFPLPGKPGQTFQCRDRRMEAELEELLALLSEPTLLPATAPLAVEPDYADYAGATFAQIWHAIGNAAGLDPEGDPEMLLQAGPPLSLALFIEALIILMAVLRGSLAAASRGVEPPAGTPPPPGKELDWARMHELMTNYMITEGGQDYLVVPEDGSDRELRYDLRSLVRRWRFEPTGSGAPVNLRVFHEPYAEIFRFETEARHFSIWRINRRALEWWISADMSAT